MAGSTVPRQKILIVEDEPHIRQLVGMFMEHAGFETGVAHDGEDGLRKFRSEPWDVVLTDRNMPRLNGEDMTVAIKAQAPLTSVIMMTAEPHLIRQPSRFEAVLAKPVGGNAIVAAVKAALAAGEPEIHAG